MPIKASLWCLVGLVFSLSGSLHAQEEPTPAAALPYPIVDTGVTDFYSDSRLIDAPATGEAFYGQDAHYSGNAPTYQDNGDGTVTDLVTGLTWQQDMGEKMTLEAAELAVAACRIGGHEDWRIPSIKELYSLIQYTGRCQGQQLIEPFIDTNFFKQPTGDTRKGERAIDAQTWSATRYTGKTMRNDTTVFGVNFVDGRIKGYPLYDPRSRQPKQMYFRFVRGNPAYGQNAFKDNDDGTVNDAATGLMWQQADSGEGMDWQTALAYAEGLSLAGYDDWRLPNAKELQSLVDYSRSPQASHSPAIAPLFAVTSIKDPNGKTNYPHYWTSTTHLDGRNPYSGAVYVAFGEAQGKMHGRVMDVHGAGAQRSDPKSGSANAYPQYFGPQGDVRYVFNYVRCVRDAR